MNNNAITRSPVKSQIMRISRVIWSAWIGEGERKVNRGGGLVLVLEKRARSLRSSTLRHGRGQKFASNSPQSIGDKAHPFVNRSVGLVADSDDLARVYRFDLAQDSEMISPTIPI